MILDILKLSFAKYLQDSGALKEGEVDYANLDLSIFANMAQFQEFIQTQTDLDISLFATDINDLTMNGDMVGLTDTFESSFEQDEQAIVDSLLQGLNGDENFTKIYDTNQDGTVTYEELAALYAQNADPNNPSATDGKITEGELMTSLLNEMLSDENFTKMLDLNKDGTIDMEELQNLLKISAAFDGDATNLSFEDIMVQLGRMSGTADNEDVLNSENPVSSADEAFDSHSGGSFNLTTPNTHQSNYVGPTGELGSTEVNKEDEQKSAKIKSNNQKIQDLNNQKAQILAAVAPQYQELVNTLNGLNTNIEKSRENIETFKSELHVVQYDLTAAKEQLENFPEAQFFKELEEAYAADRAALEAEIASLQGKETELKGKITSEEAKITDYESDKTATEKEMKKVEDTNSSPEITNINSQIETLTSENDQIREELNTKKNAQREQELKDAEVYGRCAAFRQNELVKTLLDACIDPDTKKYWDDYAYKFQGAYCGVFTSEMLESNVFEKLIGKAGLTKEQAMSIMAASGDKNPKGSGILNSTTGPEGYGYNIQGALNKAGIGVNGSIDISKMSAEDRKNAVRDGLIYPGMVFTYNENGRFHVGYIESINKDLSWNTIEGNTSVTYSDGSKENHTVGSHRRDATNPDLSAVSDPFSTWYILLQHQGYDISDYIYSEYWN